MKFWSSYKRGKSIHPRLDEGIENCQQMINNYCYVAHEVFGVRKVSLKRVLQESGNISFSWQLLYWSEKGRD